MKSVPNVSGSAAKTQNNEKISFCDTEEIMRNIVPTSMNIDDRARMLIERCVAEFASSVTNIASGYCVLDAIPLAHGVDSHNPPVPPVETPQELNSNHVIQSLQQMGYSEYYKPLSLYKSILEGTVQSKIVINRAPQLPTPAPVSKKQKGPTGLPIVAAPAFNASSVPPSAVYAAAPAGSSGKVLSRELNQQRIDDYLLNGDEPLTMTAIGAKLHVSASFVSKRAVVLRASNAVMKGLKGAVPAHKPAFPSKTPTSAIQAKQSKPPASMPFKIVTQFSSTPAIVTSAVTTNVGYATTDVAAPEVSILSVPTGIIPHSSEVNDSSVDI